MDRNLTRKSVQRLKRQLNRRGFSLCDLVPVHQLPAAVWLDEPLKTSGLLLLVGHGGKGFWTALKKKPYIQTTPHPVDHYSAESTHITLNECLPSVNSERLFPQATCSVNLIALGECLGWHSASPLGMGIHHQFGIWSAYRALWWLDAELDEPTLEKITAADVCATCTSKACIAACPASSLAWGEMPNLGRCADYRLAPESACATTCLARIACPVAPKHRYCEEQMSYHYGLALSAIKRYQS